MEARTGSPKKWTESQRDGHVERNDSLLGHNAKRLWQEQYTQREHNTPNTRCFLTYTKEQFVQQHKNAEEATSASVHRRCLSSGKKNVQTGPLKKRSPKLSPSNLFKPQFQRPLSTPIAFRSQTSFGSIQSLSSSFRHKLTPSLVKSKQMEQSYQCPVKRNLNYELMKEAMVKTPLTASSIGAKAPVSNTTMSSITPIPISFSKKRKTPNPIVTNVSKVNPHMDFFSNAPKMDETPGQKSRQVSVRCNQKNTLGTTKDDNIPSSGINILRITHPFGNSPRVTLKRSRRKPISSPLAELPKISAKDIEYSKNHLQMKGAKTKKTKTKIQIRSQSGSGKNHKNISFSPIVGRHKLSSEGSKSTRIFMPNRTKTKSTSNRPASLSTIKSNTYKAKLISQELSEVKQVIMGNRMPYREDLFQHVPTTRRPCKCKKTNCLKLYCDCFHNNSFCDPNFCNCIDCMNTEAHNSIAQPRGPRVLAMLSVMAKRPDAFDKGGRRFNTKGCSCSKSRYVTNNSFNH